MHLDTALLLPCLRVAAYALEDEVGEERNGRGIDDLQPVKPLGNLPVAAVRGNLIPVCGIQVPVYGLKDTFLASGVGIGER